MAEKKENDFLARLRNNPMFGLSRNMFSTRGGQQLPDSGGMPEPTTTQLKDFEKKSDKIVEGVVISSLKKNKKDVLHGSQNLARQLKKHREPRDWDIYALPSKRRAQEIEKSIDKKARANVAVTIKKSLPQMGLKPMFEGGAKDIFMVITPQTKKDNEVDVLKTPPGIHTIRKGGITLLSLEDEAEHKLKSMKQPMRMSKASKDINYIKNEYPEIVENARAERPMFTGLVNTSWWNSGNKTDSYLKKQLKKKKKKDLTYPEAKTLFPSLSPFSDSDNDKIKNVNDCHPFDKSRGGAFDDAKNWFYDKMSGGVASKWIRPSEKNEDIVTQQQKQFERDVQKKKQPGETKYLFVRINGEWALAGEYTPELYERLKPEVEALTVDVDPDWYRVLNRRETIHSIPQNIKTSTEQVTDFQKRYDLRRTTATEFTEGQTAKNIKEGLRITPTGQRAISSYNKMQEQSGFPPRTSGMYHPTPVSSEEAMIRQVLKTGSPSEKLQAMEYLRRREQIPRQRIMPSVQPQVQTEPTQPQVTPEEMKQELTIDEWESLLKQGYSEEQLMQNYRKERWTPPIGIKINPDGSKTVRRAPKYSPVTYRQANFNPMKSTPWKRAKMEAEARGERYRGFKPIFIGADTNTPSFGIKIPTGDMGLKEEITYDEFGNPISSKKSFFKPPVAGQQTNDSSFGFKIPIADLGYKTEYDEFGNPIKKGFFKPPFVGG